MEELVQYFKQLHQAVQMRKKMKVLQNNLGQGQAQNERKRALDTTINWKGGKDGKRAKKTSLCPHCNKMGMHTPEECRMNPANATKKTSATMLPNNVNKGTAGIHRKNNNNSTQCTVMENAMKVKETSKSNSEIEFNLKEDLNEFLAKLKAN